MQEVSAARRQGVESVGLPASCTRGIGGHGRALRAVLGNGQLPTWWLLAVHTAGPFLNACTTHVLTVSPKRQKRGMRVPTTPLTTGPLWMPMRISTGPDPVG